MGMNFLNIIRAKHWIKNTLVFLPLILSHKISDWGLFMLAVLAFTAFSLCASAVYIINDFADVKYDQQHPQKRGRPLASGAWKTETALLLSFLLFIVSFGISLFFLPILFTATLLLYLASATAYTFYLKRLAIADVLALAGLYSLRVIAGGGALNINISPWLLAFSIFFFLGLAVLKRYAELSKYQEYHNGRGYTAFDLDVIRSIGIQSGYLSVLILMLYLHSQEVRALYTSPALLWLMVPVLLYWITRLWLLVGRGEMDFDPLVFAIKDRVSYISGALIGLIFIGAI